MTSAIVFTLALEISFPFLVWNMRTRWLMMCGSVILHTGIGLFMGLGTFSLMMLVMLLSFAPPDVVRTIVGSLGEAASSWRARKEPAAGKVGKLVMTR
jgi:hypothetical protein